MEQCELCEREVERTSRHHLIPRTLHRNKWFRKNFSKEEMNVTKDLCRDCHKTIHRFISHKELGREYNTLEKLRTHPEVGKFIAWLNR